MDVYGIAAFRSRQQVLHYESILSRRGIPVRVLSTPREVAVGCGLSLQFPVEYVRRVQEVLSREHPANLIGLYMVDKRPDARARLTVLSK